MKSNERMAGLERPIDIFIDVDSHTQDAHVLLKSPPNTSHGRGANFAVRPIAGGSSPAVNNLEARIKQKQSERQRCLVAEQEHAEGKGVLMSPSEIGAKAGNGHPQQSQLTKLTNKLSQVDQRLSDAKALTDSKFN